MGKKLLVISDPVLVREFPRWSSVSVTKDTVFRNTTACNSGGKAMNSTSIIQFNSGFVNESAVFGQP